MKILSKNEMKKIAGGDEKPLFTHRDGRKCYYAGVGWTTCPFTV
jgi:bacteriocin-like protein